MGDRLSGHNQCNTRCNLENLFQIQWQYQWKNSRHHFHVAILLREQSIIYMKRVLTLHSPSADFLSALLYSSLWRAYDVLKCLQNTLYFSFYIFWGGPIIENEFFYTKKEYFQMFCCLCRVNVGFLHTGGVFCVAFLTQTDQRGRSQYKQKQHSLPSLYQRSIEMIFSSIIFHKIDMRLENICHQFTASSISQLPS